MRKSLFRGELRGVDREPCEAMVDRATTVETDEGLGRILQVGPVDRLEHAAIEEDRERSVKEDGGGSGGLLEQEAIGEGLRSSSAECEDEMIAGKGRSERTGFQTAEARFAMLLEDVADGGSGALFQMGVQIQELPTDPLGKEATEGGFAGSHEAGENDAPEIWRQGSGCGCCCGGGIELNGAHIEILFLGWRSEKQKPQPCGLRLRRW